MKVPRMSQTHPASVYNAPFGYSSDVFTSTDLAVIDGYFVMVPPLPVSRYVWLCGYVGVAICHLLGFAQAKDALPELSNILR
jgi:hypothetical protein